MENVLTDNILVDFVHLGYNGLIDSEQEYVSERAIDSIESRLDSDGLLHYPIGRSILELSKLLDYEIGNCEKIEELIGKEYAVIYADNLLEKLGISEGLTIAHEGVKRHREYNFEDDEQDLEITYTKVALERLQTLFLSDDMMARYATYIDKSYSSRDGFFSFKSNDISDYLPITEDNAHEALCYLVVEAIAEHWDELMYIALSKIGENSEIVVDVISSYNVDYQREEKRNLITSILLDEKCTYDILERYDITDEVIYTLSLPNEISERYYLMKNNEMIRRRAIAERGAQSEQVAQGVFNF